jgi:predicted TIM-barrel fold metal-dependent hydrolase
VGSARFTFGSGMPLRLGETSVAKLDLLDLSPAVRARIESENVRAFARAPGR